MQPAAAAQHVLVEQSEMFSEAPLGIAVIGMDGRLLRCNRRLEHTMGYSEEELREHHVADFTHPEDVDIDRQLIDELVAGRRESYQIEKRYVRKDGKLVCAELSVSLMRGAGGDALCAIVVLADITERKQAEQELAANREQLKMALEAARAGTWTWETASGAVQWSPELELIHGLEPGTFEGTYEAATRDVHPDDRDAFGEAVQRAITAGGGYATTYRIIAPDGSLRWVETVGDVLRDSAGNPTGMTGVCRDVTGRMSREQALRDSEQRFRALFESAAIGVSLIDLDNRIVELNETFSALLGYERNELAGWDYRKLIVEERELEKAQRQRRELLAGERDGYSCELGLRRHDGSSLPVRAWVSLVLDGAGEPSYTVAAIASMAEQRALEEQVRQAQKMEALGQLAGGVAHDFNNLLQVIAVQAGHLLDHLAPLGEEHEAVLDISHAADRARQLTSQLLTFARREPVDARLVDLDEVVSGVQRMLARLLGENVQLVSELEPRPKRVCADVVQLEQVLMNIVLNARDALPAGGRISIVTGIVELADHEERTGLDPGRYVTLSVADDGVGIAPEDLEHIFEPFFTTKEPGRGTGLGLMTVYGIVKAAGGAIAVDSERGVGTVFTVYLPQVVGTEARPERRAGSTLPNGTAAGARILLVEDNDDVRRLAGAVLCDAGHDVRMASGAEDALRLLERDARLDLLVTDFLMPVMSGKELAAAVRELAPGVPVLYMSGYDRALVAPDPGGRDGQVEVVEKPFAVGELRAKVAGLLAGREAAGLAPQR
jgi:PAS domain S-box-containing protein